MLFWLIELILIGLLIYCIYIIIKQQGNKKNRNSFIATKFPNARIIVNNGNYLFFMDDTQQFFGVDDSGKTYSYSGLCSINVHKDAIWIYHRNTSGDKIEDIKMGKDVLSSASIPLDNKSVLSIANVLLPILRKNLYNKLSSCGISPTHECVNDGEIWGCDINSKMFYNTFSSIHIYKFSDLRDVTMEDLRNNPNVKSNYRITVTVKDDFWTDGWDYTIYVDNEFILNNLLSMFKGIKERQYSYDSVGGQQNIDIMDGHEFEYFCAELLKKNGYENVDVTQGSGDQGIDVIAYKDGIKYGIQCKCYSSDIGNKAVQEVFAGKAFYECHVGVVLTNRFFTKSAEELAKKNGIILWDRNKLLELMDNI